MADLIKEGKVKHIGVSEINADQLRQANNVYPISALEIGYSLADRQIESELLPVAKELGIAVLAFANTAEGLLTSEMKAPLPENDYIIAVRHKYLLDTTIFEDRKHLPSRVIEKKHKLFLWYDKNYPVDDKTIALLNKHHLIKYYSK